MTNFKRFLTLFLIATLTMTVWAERVSQEDAAVVANNFMNAGITQSGIHKSTGKRLVLKTSAASEKQPQYYVYEYPEGGWVMIAANDAAHPIIAYSKTGFFRTDNQPKNLNSWLGHYSKEIEIAEQNGIEATEEVANEWKQLRKSPTPRKATAVVSPLIKTGWDQDSPFWNDCPKKGNSYCYTGCVATAMAQVMNYWQWPETGTGSNSVTFNNTTYTVDFTQGNYDWANMKDTYSSSNATQRAAVAKLMYHCGVAVGMEYGTDGSAAYTINWNDENEDCAQNALWKYFGYKKSDIKGYFRNGFSGYYSSWTEAKWIQMLKDELDAGRPIMYAGADGNGSNAAGHSFICDGYDSDNMFHFNWGWANWCDGYYNVNSLVTTDPGSGGGNGDYSYQQDVIVGIQRPVNGHNIVTNGTGCTITPNKARVENGNSVTATITPTDATYDFTSITVKLGSTTLTSTTHYTLSADNKTLTIKGTAITGSTDNDLTITIVWTKNRYSYSLLGTNCTEEAEGMLNKNAALNLTITPDAGYTLANAICWTVEMGNDILTYGTDFTYNAGSNTFYIASVTGDVTILAEAGRPVTWSANGSTHATNLAIDDKLTLPANPADCSGTDGKKFVGWTASSSVSGNTAPTFVKDGDTYSAATYYAVYATASGSGGGSGNYELVEAAPSNWVGDYLIAYDGETFADGSTGGTSGIGAQNNSVDPGTNLSGKVVAASWGNSYYVSIEASETSGKYLLKTQDGLYNYQTSNANGIATTSNKSTADNYPLTITFNSSNDIAITVSSTAFHYNTQGYFRFYKNAGQSAIYLYKKASGSGTSYSDYSLTCGVPCSNTPVMSFTNETVNKTTADASYTQAVTITGKGSGQTVAYSSSDETVATVNNSGLVTLQGKVGSTTITASVEANGTYCAASASYTLNVSAAPINVTMYYNGTSQTLNNQTPPYTLPTTGAYVADMCDGDWTFAGWYNNTYDKNTTAPTYITELTATGAAYAVYTTTENDGGGASIPVTKTMSTFAAISGNVDSDENISFAAAQGTAGTAPAVNNGEIRIYQNGGTLTITANNSKKITDITIGSSMNTSVTYSIDGGSTSSSQNISANGTLPLTDLNASSILFTCTGTDKNHRLYLNYLSVTYSGEGGSGSNTTYYATSPDCSAPIDHSVTWKACGETFHTQGFADGAALVLPASTPADNAGKTFAGWTATEHHTGASAPTDLFTEAGSKTVTADVTYYAVFH